MAQIRPLAWEPPYAERVAREMAKRQKKKKKKESSVATAAAPIQYLAQEISYATGAVTKN